MEHTDHRSHHSCTHHQPILNTGLYQVSVYTPL
jgi:hypothetical protein